MPPAARVTLQLHPKPQGLAVLATWGSGFNRATFPLTSVHSPRVPLCSVTRKGTSAPVRISSHPTTCFLQKLLDWEQEILLQDSYLDNTSTPVTRGQLQAHKVTHKH